MDVCRLCLIVIRDSNYSFVDDTSDITHRQKLITLFPELDIDLVDLPVLCESCSDIVETIYNFKIKCLETDDIITKYIQHYNLRKPIDLVDIVTSNQDKYTVGNGKEVLKIVNIENDNSLCESECTNYKSEDREFEEIVVKSEPDESNPATEEESTLVTDENVAAADDLKTGRSLTSLLQENGVVYICTICKNLFTDKNLFSEHYKHHEELKFRCTVCSRGFIRSYDLKRHMKVHDKNIVCEICNKKFTDNKLFIQHRSEHPQEPSICVLCNNSYARRNHLMTHMLEIHGVRYNGDVFQCEACKEIFSDKDAVLSHAQIHADEKSYVCHVCGKGFRTGGAMRQHMGYHSNVKPHKCSECDMTFRLKSSLVQHLRTHTGERPYKCDKCAKGFAQSSTLKEHIDTVHNKSTRFTCHLCPMQFKFKVSLRLHVQKQHLGHVEKRHVCDVCGKAFRLHYALKGHKLRHAKGTTHICIICKKGFIGSGALNRHMRTHTGEKPFECHICKFKCSQKSNLRIHIKSHLKGQVSTNCIDSTESLEAILMSDDVCEIENNENTSNVIEDEA